MLLCNRLLGTHNLSLVTTNGQKGNYGSEMYLNGKDEIFNFQTFAGKFQNQAKYDFRNVISWTIRIREVFLAYHV